MKISVNVLSWISVNRLSDKRVLVPMHGGLVNISRAVVLRAEIRRNGVTFPRDRNMYYEPLEMRCGIFYMELQTVGKTVSLP